MKKNITKHLLPLASVLIIILSASNAFGQFPPENPGWNLVFNEEFDSIYPNTYFNTAVWDRTYPWGNSGAYQLCNCDEFHQNCDTLPGRLYFTKDTSNFKIDTVGSGTLTFSLKKENYVGLIDVYPLCDSITNQTLNGEPWIDQCRYFYPEDTVMRCHYLDTAHFQYTNAMLYSKYRFKYGYYEMKFRIPATPSLPTPNPGITSTWWLWIDNGQKATEIDMFEIDNMDNSGGGNVHYTKKDQKDEAGQGASLPTPLTEEWHIYGLEWGTDRIDFYLDGVKFGEYNYKPDSMLAMNMVVASDMAQNFCRRFSSNNTFPFKYEINYIRVYHQIQDCQSDVVICSFDPLNYVNSVKKSIVFNSNCTSPFSANTTAYLRASEFIEFNEGFQALSSTDLTFDITRCQEDSYVGYLPNAPGPMPSSFLNRKQLFKNQ